MSVDLVVWALYAVSVINGVMLLIVDGRLRRIEKSLCKRDP